MFSVVFTADAMLMRSESSGRYFTKDGMLPPLVSLSAVRSNQTTSVPYVEDEGRSIPVVYTNDPCSVEEWLSENLPTNGCTIGFDVEVSQEEVIRHVEIQLQSVILFQAMKTTD